MSDDAMQVKIWGCVDIWIDGIRIYRCGTSETRILNTISHFILNLNKMWITRDALLRKLYIFTLLARREDTIKRNKGMRISRILSCGTGCRSTIITRINPTEVGKADGEQIPSHHTQRHTH